jgi:hypothetical protein
MLGLSPGYGSLQSVRRSLGVKNSSILAKSEAFCKLVGAFRRQVRRHCRGGFGSCPGRKDDVAADDVRLPPEDTWRPWPDPHGAAVGCAYGRGGGPRLRMTSVGAEVWRVFRRARCRRWSPRRRRARGLCAVVAASREFTRIFPASPHAHARFPRLHHATPLNSEQEEARTPCRRAGLVHLPSGWISARPPRARCAGWWCRRPPGPSCCGPSTRPARCRRARSCAPTRCSPG